MRFNKQSDMIGDDTERYVRDPQDRGHIEWRWTPAYGVEIVNLYVEDGYRREGVGRELLRALIAEVGGNAKTIYAITRSENATAQRWYEACGFTVVGSLTGFYDPNRTDVDAIMYGRKAGQPV